MKSNPILTEITLPVLSEEEQACLTGGAGLPEFPIGATMIDDGDIPL